MRPINYVLTCCWMLLIWTAGGELYAQNSANTNATDSSDSTKMKRWELNGYVKYMTSIYSIPGATPSFLQDNLLHNRFNFQWYPNKHWTMKAALRTRLFFGEFVRQQPQYGQRIIIGDSLQKGYRDYLSWVLLDQSGIAMHSTLDRLYLQYTTNKWDIRLGRQRINWGINTLWNPNDIFNTFLFTDFDYEERPGADALRIQYFTGTTSSIEFAVKAFTRWENVAAAFLWKTNQWAYDFQVLAGMFGQDLVLGGGWAGQLGQIGFKGEFSYFYTLVETPLPRHSFTGTISFDYLFPTNTYLTLGFMYHMNGLLRANASQLFAYQPSAKNLYPYRYSTLITASHPISPIATLALTAVYSPGGSHALFLSPSFTYLINERWDLSCIMQLAFNEANGQYISPTQVIFLRFKWSF